ncbi:MAG: ribonuclease HII [Kiritimatiellae bacterium]|nr:ribonuclease HII [Kiritimatiellia bacterium]
MLEHERDAWKAGRLFVAGVDEAGRGPLAGPVVAAAVWFDRGFAEREEKKMLAGVDDSKRLSPARREAVYELLVNCPQARIAFSAAEVEEISRLDILHATHAAMARALEALDPPPDFALVDGLPVPGLPVPSRAIVKGDAKSLSIAAASIVAKVVRDRRMLELDKLYPQYGFAQHKGYGTAAHLAAIRKHGPCPAHRPTFAPVRQLTLF